MESQIETISKTPFVPEQSQIIVKRAIPIDKEVTRNSLQENSYLVPGRKSFYYTVDNDFLIGKRLKNSKCGIRFQKYENV